MNPLVSVIIPIYNNERYLRETIATIFNQDYRPFEVIAVDDGSTDQSASIIQSYPDIHYVYQHNQGPGGARNTGVHVARGEYIAFLDADDLWATDKLSKHVCYMEANHYIGYTIAHLLMFLTKGAQKPHWQKEEFLHRAVPSYLPSGLVVRRATLEKVGKFDPSLINADDGDWFFRANDMKIPMAILPDVLLYRRIHEANLSHNLAGTNKSLLETVRRSIARKRQQSRTPC